MKVPFGFMIVNLFPRACVTEQQLNRKFGVWIFICFWVKRNSEILEEICKENFIV